VDYRTLTRDPSKVKADLVKTENGQFMTKSGCTIIIPKRYVEKQLASFTGNSYTLAIFAIVVGDSYSVSIANAVVSLNPATISERSFGDTKYIEFAYEPGAIVIGKTAMVRNKQLPYQIYNEFEAKGRLPWFMSYLDLGNLFDTAQSRADLSLHTNHAIFELFAAVMARDPQDRSKYFRHTLRGKEDIVKREPVYVAFRNIQSQATNTTTKLMGSYFREALASALVNPSERLEGFEKLLRL
jgi:hypothetical protein